MCRCKEHKYHITLIILSVLLLTDGILFVQCASRGRPFPCHSPFATSVDLL